MDGLKILFTDLLQGLGLSDVISTILVSLVVVILWIVVGVVLNLIVRKAIYRVMKSKNFHPRTTTIGKLTTSVSRYTIWLIIVFVILRELNVDVTPLIASAGVAGIALGFGAQRIIQDFISGFFIMFESVFNVGDLIEADGFKGSVKSLGLRTTVIENWKGEVKTITNGDIKGVVNFSKNSSLAVVEVGVAYETDMLKLSEIMEEFITTEFDKNENIIEKPKFLGVTKLDSSSINLLLVAKTKTLQHFQVERDLRRDLVVFFQKNGIEIPFPQVVVTHAKD